MRTAQLQVRSEQPRFGSSGFGTLPWSRYLELVTLAVLGWTRKDDDVTVSSYRGRHAGRHAAPTPRRRGIVSALGRPAVSVSLALVTVATGAAAVSAQEQRGTSGAAFTISASAQHETDTTVAVALADRAQQAADRSNVNSRKSLVAAQAEEEARQRAAAEAAARQAEADRVAREAKRQSTIEHARENPQEAARLLMSDAGFSDDQWSCLNSLVNGESTWNYLAENPSSGAYGLFQSLPGNKMSSVADDWATNPVTQITWGLGYIKSVYGTPCGAWSAWNSRFPHWY